MKNLQMLFCFFAFTVLAVSGQDTISLQTALSSAISNFPSVNDPSIMRSVGEYKLNNIRTSWFPSLEINAQATWQSDVVKIDVELPFPGIQFPVSPQDQYRLSLDVRQTLFDGGIAKIRQQIEEIRTLVNIEESNSGLNAFKATVCDLFFNILILEGNERVLMTQLKRLSYNQETAEASFLNGVLLITDLQLIEAEIIKIRQNLFEVSELKQTAFQALNLRTGLNLDENTVLSNPDFLFNPTSAVNRSENKVFELRKQQFKESAHLAQSKRLPFAFAFSQLGYGRPGLNILNNEFDTYYMVGAGIKWQLWDWNQLKNEKKILELQSNLIDNQQRSFNQSLEIALLNQLTAIENRKKKIAAASEMKELRTKISENYSVQLEKGVIKTIDYLTVFNEEVISGINYETEKILLQKAITEYLLLKGDL